MRVYLDHAATAPMPAVVRDAMVEAMHKLGNPASTHAHGQAASEVLESARERISQQLGCDPAEVILTGGGTESINLALKGMWWARRRLGIGPIILVADGEHHASFEAAEWLRDTQGAELHWLAIDADGVLHPGTLRAALTQFGADQVALVSFLWANNEVGSIQPVRELTEVAQSFGVPVHVDAVAALGQVPLNFHESGAAALSLSAHKIGGPGGVGALLLSRTAQADALFHGGSQQRSRAGTQNIAGAVGFAAALEEAYSTGFLSRMEKLAHLRDRVISGIRSAIPDAILRGSDPHPKRRGSAMNGMQLGEPQSAIGASGAISDGVTAGSVTHSTPQPSFSLEEVRLPGNAHFTFPGCQGDSLVYLLDTEGISASVGSACQAGVTEVSHVLLAMGMPEVEAVGALRFTLGVETTEAEVDRLLAVLPEAVSRARTAGLA